MKEIWKKLITVLMLFGVFTLSLFAEELYKAKAVASFYGTDFHGKKTSSGEIFDMNGFTCANKELPFDTVLKVTYLKNGKSVQVRVNDRGPFVIGRDVDLSTAAAKQLGMTGAGLADVKLEIVKMGPDTKLSRDTAASAKKIMAQKEAASGTTTKNTAETKPAVKADTKKQEKTPAAVKVPEGKLWDIQVGSFSSRSNAENLAKKLSKAGFKKIVFQTTKDGIVRVCVSQVPSEKLTETQNKLKEAGFKDFVTKERKKI